MELRNIPVDKIEPNPFQPRVELDIDRLRELAESMKTYSVIQPVKVIAKDNGTYQLVFGERRWRAAMMAEISEVPALVVGEMTEGDQRIESLIENVHREDLGNVEKGLAIYEVFIRSGIDKPPRDLAKEITIVENIRRGISTQPLRNFESIQEIVKSIGKGYTTVKNWLDAISSDEGIVEQELEKPKDEQLDINIISKIGRIEDKKLQKKIYEKIRSEDIIATVEPKTFRERASKFISVIKKLPKEEQDRFLEPMALVDVDTMEAMTIEPQFSKEDAKQLVATIKDYEEEREQRIQDPDFQARKKSALNLRNHAIIESVLEHVFCPVCGSDWTNLQWSCHPGLDVKRARMIAEKNFKERRVISEEDEE